MTLHMAWRKTKCDWFYLSVLWSLGRALVFQSGQGSQTLSRQSEGLATWKPPIRETCLKTLIIFEDKSSEMNDNVHFPPRDFLPASFTCLTL